MVREERARETPPGLRCGGGRRSGAV